MQKLGVLTLLTILLSVTSCKNDFDVNGPLTEKIVVYGLLNYADSAQYLKIYKTFQTEDNVLIAAQNMDNYLMYDSLEVLLICHDETNNLFSYHYFDTTTAIPKDSGIFSNPINPHKQVLYVNRDVLNSKDSCILQIKNKYTGKLMAESGCRFVYPKSTNTTNPFNIQTSVVAVANTNGVLLTNGTLDLRMPAQNAYRYEAYYNFYYYEKENASAPEVLKGPIKVNIGTIAHSNPDSWVSITWNPSSFFSILLNQLSHLDGNSQITRRSGPVHLNIWAAGEDYSLFIERNSQSSLSIIEERPTISNISGGMGLFSSRYHVVMENFTLSPASVQHLISDPTYSSLHFTN